MSYWGKPILMSLPPETAHNFSFALAKFLESLWFPQFRIAKGLEKEVFGLRFPGPVGLAGGFDKNAEIAYLLSKIGFGFLELGTVTPNPQPGNPKPRIFRFPNEQALLNRLGFNNKGMEVFAKNLQEAISRGLGCPVGINLGKNKTTADENAQDEYLRLYSRLKHLGDYFVINVSSPNTPGLRNLQSIDFLENLMQLLRVKHDSLKPILLKLAPDLSNSDLSTLVEAAQDIGFSGLILTNTLLDRKALPQAKDFGEGGISGGPLKERSRECLQLAKRHSNLPIISVGGIDSAEEVKLRLDMGAELVQIYTSLIYKGPFWPMQLHKALLK